MMLSKRVSYSIPSNCFTFVIHSSNIVYVVFSLRTQNQSDLNLRPNLGNYLPFETFLCFQQARDRFFRQVRELLSQGCPSIILRVYQFIKLVLSLVSVRHGAFS